jgi:transcriptional regulator
MAVSALPQGALDLIILKTLARGANHGYGILLHVHDASASLLRVEEGSLYPALHRLEQAGLLAGEWQLSEHNRRARYYRVTPKGRRRLEAEERNWARVAEGVARLLSLA